MDEKFTITIKVAGEPFSLNIPREEEKFYRDAADMINNKLAFVRERYGDRIADKGMKMVALIIAVNLAKKESQKDSSPVFDRLGDLDAEISALLED